MEDKNSYIYKMVYPFSHYIQTARAGVGLATKRIHQSDESATEFMVYGKTGKE